ncbi:hypothetical protein TSUD_295260 [Trifolium subterraneum]|uniref:Uncharacterized protein n=1 Tax=Trifolium subterraneum TaxID=3900 RepID=A0A2Z6NGP8_TRISU|nr:hypothetical protein TSUD_295260 [Trifolium subterraneum]
MGKTNYNPRQHKAPTWTASEPPPKMEQQTKQNHMVCGNGNDTHTNDHKNIPEGVDSKYESHIRKKRG